MKILVVGAGAVGGYFGARLLHAGADVTFLVRPRRSEQLASHGLAVRSPTGDLHLPEPPVIQAQDLRAGYDLVLLSCKAYDLVGAMDGFAPAVGTDTAILPLLNGMQHLDALEQRFGPQCVLGGLSMISSTLDGDGHILHLNESHLLAYGERKGGRSARIERIEATFAPAGFEGRASDDILQEMWEKWVLIATLAGITCLMRASIGAIAAAGGTQLTVDVIGECAAVAARAGYAPRAVWLQRFQHVLTEAGSALTASMLRDIEASRPVEADQIVGDLLRRAGTSVPTPLLHIINTHLRAYEASRAQL